MKEYPLVIIESPYASGNPEQTERFVKYARECLLDSIKRGECPFASHLLYTQVLDDTIPEERDLGIGAGFEWKKKADYTVVYCDNGISRGMKAGIDYSKAIKQHVEYRKLY